MPSLSLSSWSMRFWASLEWDRAGGMTALGLSPALAGAARGWGAAGAVSAVRVSGGIAAVIGTSRGASGPALL